MYNLAAQTVAIEADVTFDSNGPITSSFSHTPSTSSIAINTAGVYSLVFSASGVEPSQFAGFLNGILITGSVYGSGAGTQQNTGQVIFLGTAGDALTIRNHSSAAAVTLQTLAGGTQINTNASVVLLKLA